jgi:kynureninase
MVQEELHAWATVCVYLSIVDGSFRNLKFWFRVCVLPICSGVEGHFDHHPYGRGWVKIQDRTAPFLAELVGGYQQTQELRNRTGRMTCHIGAREKEVACMGTLTTNLHLMMNTFYKPSSDRYKILCEAKAFPSDQAGLFFHLRGSGQKYSDRLNDRIRQQYAFTSQALLHGYDPKEAIIELSPREGEYTLRLDDILEAITKEGSSIALVLFSGVQYYTGQWFPMASITRAAKEQVNISSVMHPF